MFIDHWYFSLALDLFMVSNFSISLSGQLNLTVCFNVPQASKEETQFRIALTSSSVEKQPGEPHTSPSHREIRACVHSFPSRLFSGLTKQQEVEEINSQGQKMLKKKGKTHHRSSRRENELRGRWTRFVAMWLPEKKGMDSRHSAERVGPQRQFLPPFKCKLFVPLAPSKASRSFPGGLNGKESTCNAEDLGSIPGLGRSPGEGKQPTQCSCLETPHGQRSLAGYRPRGRRVRHDWATKLTQHTTQGVRKQLQHSQQHSQGLTQHF